MNKQILTFIFLILFISVSNQFRVLEESEDQDLTCYGLIFDAGSSSTKMQIYNWPCRTTDTVPKINPQQVEVQKAKPGIATFADKIDEIDNYLGGLIDYANNHIYEGDRQYTPIMLFGTAGLRVIPEEDQKKIIEKVNDIFKRSGYLYNSNWIKIISGQEEGASMWTSVNYLLGSLDESPESERYTAVTIDLGGASTQIAFGPKREINDEFNLLINFPNFNNYNIYSVSYLGFGNDMERNQVIDKQGDWSEDKKTVTTPCYYKGYEGKYGEDGEITLIGAGNPQLCREEIIKTFELEKCSKVQKFFGCGLLGTYQPPVPYTKPIYALSGITKAVDFFELNTKPYTPQQLLDKSFDLCSKPWEQIQKEYPDNEYIDTQCFLTMYSATLMIDGYNIAANRLVNSPDEINGVEPSWTLGAMFYAVAQMPCKEESPLCKMAKMMYPNIEQGGQILEIQE